VFAGRHLAAVEHPLAEAVDENGVRAVEHRPVEPQVNAGDGRRLQSADAGEERVGGDGRRQQVEHPVERYRKDEVVGGDRRAVAEVD
jgi:hypothetical protein